MGGERGKRERTEELLSGSREVVANSGPQKVWCVKGFVPAQH